MYVAALGSTQEGGKGVRDDSCMRMPGAGLTFFNLPAGPAASFLHLGIIFFIMLLFELLPFCYMSFYVFDRKFYMADRAADLYHTSAYYLGHMAASACAAFQCTCHLACHACVLCI